MHANLADIDWFYGRRDGRAMAEARKGVERAETFGSPFFRIVALRGLALAHYMQGTGAQAIPLLEGARPHTVRGGLGHQFEASFLSALAECYLQAGFEDKAEQTAQEAIASAQGSRSRAWEIRAWIAWMDLPVTSARRARAAEGLARMQELIDASGAEGYRPWLCLAREKYAETAAEKQRCREAALHAFGALGATDHIARLRN
jgi:adenylate cyclase